MNANGKGKQFKPGHLTHYGTFYFGNWSGPNWSEDRACKICGETFTARHRNATLCGDACRAENQRRQKTEGSRRRRAKAKAAQMSASESDVVEFDPGGRVEVTADGAHTAHGIDLENR